MTHKHPFWHLDLGEIGEKAKGGEWRRTNLATHSLPELIRKTFYHEIWSTVLKAAANVCLYPQCALPQSAFRLHKMSALEWRFDTGKESMCLLLWVSKAKVGTLLQGSRSLSPLLAPQLTEQLKSVHWCLEISNHIGILSSCVEFYPMIAKEILGCWTLML